MTNIHPKAGILQKVTNFFVVKINLIHGNQDSVQPEKYRKEKLQTQKTQ